MLQTQPVANRVFRLELWKKNLLNKVLVFHGVADERIVQLVSCPAAAGVAVEDTKAVFGMKPDSQRSSKHEDDDAGDGQDDAHDDDGDGDGDDVNGSAGLVSVKRDGQCVRAGHIVVQLNPNDPVSNALNKLKIGNKVLPGKFLKFVNKVALARPSITGQCDSR